MTRGGAAHDPREGAPSLRCVHGAGDPGDAVLALAYEPGGSRYVAARASGQVHLHDARTGEALASFDLESSLAGARVRVAFDVARGGIACAFHAPPPLDGGATRGFEDGATHCAFLVEATGLVARRLAPLAGVLDDLRIAPDGSALWVTTVERPTSRNAVRTVRLYASGFERLLYAYDDGEEMLSGEACGAFGSDADGRVTALLVDAGRDRLDAFDPLTGTARASERLLPDWPDVRAASAVRCTGGEALLRLLVGEYDRTEYLLAARRLDAGAPWRQLASADWYSTASAFGARVACVVDPDHHRVELYSLDDGALLGRCLIYPAHGYVGSVALAPDDRTLLVGTSTGEVLVLSIAPLP